MLVHIPSQQAPAASVTMLAMLYSQCHTSVHTWPKLAAAMGLGSKLSKMELTGAPKPSSTMPIASLEEKEGTRSCSFSSSCAQTCSRQLLAGPLKEVHGVAELGAHSLSREPMSR